MLPLLTALVLLAAAAPADKPIKPLPTLAKEPKLDGELKDFTPAADFKMPDAAQGSSAALKVKGAFKKDTLYVAVSIEDDHVLPDDRLDVTLYFPDSGTTSRGYIFRFGSEGLRAAVPEGGPPAWSQALVKAGARTEKKGWTIEIAFPARSLPRFQAVKPLVLSICAEYADVDTAGGEPSMVSTCPTAEMAGGPTRLPDEFRKNLKLAPPADVEGLESREKGWVGYSKLHYPTWAVGDTDFTQESLAGLIAGDSVIDAASVSLPIPKQLQLNDNRPIFTILTGKNPYVKETCVTGNELRMAMYVVKGTVASRVLEWPAATCSLGRAMRFELTSDGNLQIGYTNGSTAHFVWTADHFERSELGLAD